MSRIPTLEEVEELNRQYSFDKPYKPKLLKKDPAGLPRGNRYGFLMQYEMKERIDSIHDPSTDNSTFQLINVMSDKHDMKKNEKG